MFDYFDLVRELLDEVQRSEQDSMERAATLIADTIARGRVLHYFAAGHSHMLGEEMFYRAGGLAPVNAIMEPSLMVSNGASKSSKLECLHGLAKVVLEESGIERGDVLMVASTSGVNAVPVEMAAEASKLGACVIGITSISASKATPLRNGSGRRLFELVDIVIDTHVPYGDAAIQVEGVAQRIAPIHGNRGSYRECSGGSHRENAGRTGHRSPDIYQRQHSRWAGIQCCAAEPVQKPDQGVLSGYQPSWHTTTKRNGLGRRSTFLIVTAANSVDNEAPATPATWEGKGVDVRGHVQMPLVAAIDGGGTKTLFLLAEADGTVIGIGRGGPLNALFVPPDEAIRSVRQAAVGAERGGHGVHRCARAYASAPELRAISWTPESPG